MLGYPFIPYYAAAVMIETYIPKDKEAYYKFYYQNDSVERNKIYPDTDSNNDKNETDADKNGTDAENCTEKNVTENCTDSNDTENCIKNGADTRKSIIRTRTSTQTDEDDLFKMYVMNDVTKKVIGCHKQENCSNSTFDLTYNPIYPSQYNNDAYWWLEVCRSDSPYYVDKFCDSAAAESDSIKNLKRNIAVLILLVVLMTIADFICCGYCYCKKHKKRFLSKGITNSNSNTVDLSNYEVRSIESIQGGSGRSGGGGGSGVGRGKKGRGGGARGGMGLGNEKDLDGEDDIIGFDG